MTHFDPARQNLIRTVVFFGHLAPLSCIQTKLRDLDFFMWNKTILLVSVLSSHINPANDALLQLKSPCLLAPLAE